MPAANWNPCQSNTTRPPCSFIRSSPSTRLPSDISRLWNDDSVPGLPPNCAGIRPLRCEGDRRRPAPSPGEPAGVSLGASRAKGSRRASRCWTGGSPSALFLVCERIPCRVCASIHGLARAGGWPSCGCIQAECRGVLVSCGSIDFLCLWLRLASCPKYKICVFSMPDVF